MNRETALTLASKGIRELLYMELKHGESRLKDYGSFLALLTDLKQLFDANDYIKENLK